MIEMLTDDYQYLAFVIVILIISLYYVLSKQFWQGLIGLIVVSYLQGLIISLWFYPDIFLNFFTMSVLIAIYYYILFPKVAVFVVALKAKYSSDTKTFENNVILTRIKEVWGLQGEKYLFKEYSGKHSFGAFTCLVGRRKEIYIGEDLLAKLNADEVVYVVSHEIAHHTGGYKYLVYQFLFPFVYMIPCYACALLLIFLKNANIYSFLITTAILFILGVVLFNYTYWKIEYRADLVAVRKTRDKISAVSSFRKIAEEIGEKNRNIILNLLTSDHPSCSDRITMISSEKI